MKLLRYLYNHGRQTVRLTDGLLLLYFSLAALLPLFTEIWCVWALMNSRLATGNYFSYPVTEALVLTVWVGTCLMVLGGLVFYCFINAVLLSRLQSVESIDR